MNGDQYTRWRAALGGAKLDMGERGNPPAGFFRRNAGKRGWEAFAVWYQDGAVFCERNMFGDGSNMDADKIDEMFASEVYAVPHAVYTSVMEGNDWPIEHTARLTLKEVAAGIGMTEELGKAKTGSASILGANERAVIGDNSSKAAPHELLLARINDLVSDRKTWLSGIGGAIATQEQADRAAAFAEAFGALEKEAVEAHRVAKEPHLKAGREVDKTWKPIGDLADEAKRAAKALLTPYLKKQQDDAREAARKAAAEAAERQEPALVEPIKPRAINGGRGVTLRTVRSAAVTDLPKLAAYLAGMANPAPDFVEVCRKLAEKALKANIDVPGAEMVEKQEAA